MNPLTKGKIPFSFLDIDFRKSTVPDVFIKREEILPVKGEVLDGFRICLHSASCCIRSDISSIWTRPAS